MRYGLPSSLAPLFKLLLLQKILKKLTKNLLIYFIFYPEEFELFLESLFGGLGGNGGNFVPPPPGRLTICPITRSTLGSFNDGNTSSESAEDGGVAPLPSLPLSVAVRRKIGSL